VSIPTVERRATVTANYTHILDLARETEPPARGIVSNLVYQDDRMKVVVMGLAQGHVLAEHTAPKPALLYFVKGEAAVSLGDDVKDAQAGTWVHMPEGLKHSIQAKAPLVVMLTLLK
jgi:quercetin dioxygenase-like cupin family protein